MSETEMKPNEIILGERNYEAALNLVIARAESETKILCVAITLACNATNYYVIFWAKTRLANSL
jgi:hypothetical protein